MKEGRTSLTAELSTAARAIESAKPEDRRVCYDALAKDFLSPPLRIILKSRLLARMAIWCAERIAPGVPSEVVVRTRYIDDCLRACIDDGIGQLVILGAGYDSRAYRFDGLKGKVKVFELDVPATQRVKIKRVTKLFGCLPDNVVYIPIDLDKERLDKKLFESGYDKNVKTLFIWEGVTYYLTAEAVNETLAFVAKNSGDGSSIIFDYAFQSVLDRASKLKQVHRALSAYERICAPFTSEHFVFGVREGTIEEFLSRRGFYQIENVSGEILETAFKGIRQGREVSRLGGLVHARVKPPRSPQRDG